MKIAVIGTFQVGKSTLINCLISDLLADVGCGLTTTHTLNYYRKGESFRLLCFDKNNKCLKDENRQKNIDETTIPKNAVSIIYELAGEYEALNGNTLIDTPGLDSSGKDAALDNLCTANVINDSSVDLLLLVVPNAQLDESVKNKVLPLIKASGKRLIVLMNCCRSNPDPLSDQNQEAALQIDEELRSSGINHGRISLLGKSIVLPCNVAWWWASLCDKIEKNISNPLTRTVFQERCQRMKNYFSLIRQPVPGTQVLQQRSNLAPLLAFLKDGTLRNVLWYMDNPFFRGTHTKGEGILHLYEQKKRAGIQYALAFSSKLTRRQWRVLNAKLEKSRSTELSLWYRGEREGGASFEGKQRFYYDRARKKIANILKEEGGRDCVPFSEFAFIDESTMVSVNLTSQTLAYAYEILFSLLSLSEKMGELHQYERIAEIETEMALAKSENESLRCRLDELRKTILQREELVAKLKVEITLLKSENNSFKNRIEELLITTTQQEEQVAKLRGDVALLQSTNKSLKNCIDDLNKTVDGQENKIADLLRICADFKRENDALKSRVMELDSANALLERVKTELQGQVVKLTTELRSERHVGWLWKAAIAFALGFLLMLTIYNEKLSSFSELQEELKTNSLTLGQLKRELNATQVELFTANGKAKIWEDSYNKQVQKERDMKSQINEMNSVRHELERKKQEIVDLKRALTAQERNSKLFRQAHTDCASQAVLLNNYKEILGKLRQEVGGTAEDYSDLVDKVREKVSTLRGRKSPDANSNQREKLRKELAQCKSLLAPIEEWEKIIESRSKYRTMEEANAANALLQSLQESMGVSGVNGVLDEKSRLKKRISEIESKLRSNR